MSIDAAVEPLATATSVGAIRRAVWEFPAPQEDVSLDLVTPAVLTIDGRPTFFPNASLVFGSVHRRWCAAGLPPLWIESDSERLAPVIARPDGLTTAVVLARGVQRHGVMGRCDYDVSTLDEATRRNVQLLAEVACFTGVGKAVGHGMGRVMTEWRRSMQRSE